jgi:biopolymer transport protein ExbD
MTMSQAGKESMQSEINMTPMIDILLVLLIIFMVIVPATSKGESASAPRPSMAQPQRDDAVVLEILKGRQGNAAFRINQHDVSRQDLAARLAAIYATRAQRILFIKADDQLSFMQIAEAIDIGHAAGIDRFGLITPKVALDQ